MKQATQPIDRHHWWVGRRILEIKVLVRVEGRVVRGAAQVVVETDPEPRVSPALAKVLDDLGLSRKHYSVDRVGVGDLDLEFGAYVSP